MSKIGKKLFILLAVCALAGNSWAVDRYVDPAGTCGGNSPCYTTIMGAISASSPFDVIHIGPGTYNEIVDFTTSDLTIIGAGEGLVTIDATGLSSPNNAGFHVTGANVSVSGFTLQSDATSDPRYGLKFSNTTNGTIQNVTVTNFYRTGIDIPSVSGLVINDVYVHDNFGGGIGLRDVSNANISNVTTNNNPWGGLRIQTYYGTINNVVVSGSNSFGELGVGGIGVYLEQGNSTPAGPPFSITYGVTGAPDVLLQSVDALYALSGTDDEAPQYQRVILFPTLAQAVTAAGVANYSHITTNKYIRKIDDGSFWVAPGMLIQAAVNAAAPGDEIHVLAGTYTESVNVNKRVKIIGEGSVLASLTTVTSSTGPVFTIAASGLDSLNPVLFQDMQLLPIGVPGFDVASGSWSYVNLNNVRVIGTNPTNDTESEVGLRIWSTTGYPSLSNLVVTDCAFDNLHYGWYFMKQVGAFSDNVTNVSVTGTSFTHNAAKGIYVEKLSDAVFTDCEVNNNGWNLSFFNAAWNAGFDFNLKGQQTYQNLALSYCDFEGNATGATNGAAIMIKARGSGGDPSYDANPASLTNVQISNCRIFGNERGVRFGEPGKANTMPAGKVFECLVNGNANGDVINSTTVCCDAGANWWGSAAPNFATQSFGTVDYSPWMGLVGTNTNPGYSGNFSSLWVDDNSPSCGGSNIVQEAVNLVSGSTINLMPGTYVGQVHAANFANLNIIGSGVANTFIKAPATAMTDFFVTAGPNNNYPIVFFDSSTANISNLTIDGDGKGNLQYRFIGLAYWNSSGDVNNVDIVSVRNTPLDGSQHGVGLYVFHDVAGSYDVDVTNVSISDFQKNGTVFAGAGTNVDCDNVSIVGAGPMGVPMPAQNGFQFSPSTTGTLLDCSVDGIVYTGPSAVATSILSYGDIDLTNTSVSNGHVGIYGIDADVTVNGGTFTSTNAATAIEKYGLFFYSTGAALATNRPMPQPIDASASDFSRDGDRSLDANEVVVIENVEVIGDGSAGGYGVSAYVNGDNLDFTMTDSKVAYWNYGVDLTANGGTIAPASVTGSSLTNTVNTYDNTSGHTWDSNCYSDFTSNGGFPTQYNVAGGGGNVDANPNPNGCSDVNFIVSDPLIGCDAPCNTTLLYITLDAAGLPNLQLVFTLPAGFSTVGGIVTPGSNVDPNLLNAYATVSGQVVTVDMGFQDPGSTGDNTKYVACFTLTNTGAGTGVHTVYGNSSLWIDGLGGNHVNELLLGSIDITVDCTDPAAPTTFVNTGTCAYGSGYMPADVFSVTGLTAGGGAALQTVWLTANGNASPTYPITLVGTDPYSFTFPAPGTEASFYDLLNDLDGCNTLNLHVTDAECNTAVFDLLNVGWDATPPTLNVTDGITGCYNASTGAAALLGLDIDVSALSALNCRATSGTLTITSITNPGGTPFTFPLSGDLADFPDLANNAALWSWMITNGQGNVPAGANGETYTYSVTAGDCAGNVSLAQTWDICLDFTTPGNTVSTFDARPADGGVWLNWAWTPDVSQAVEMRIYRSPISGGYPAYNPPLRDSYDTTPAALVGWTLVETQIIGSGQVSSATETDANNRGDYAQHTTYWLDAQGGWEAGETLPDGNTEGPDATTWRDIYRYVTFVRDAGGNWSTGYAPVQGTNVDRSTNYWLGDFSPADDNGSNNSRGRVDTDDLTLLSAVYFSNVVGDYRNIGPVVLPAENGNVGKSIPNPDALGSVSFQDLVPFSFNFNMVSPVGTFATEFVVEPDPTVYRPFNRLDAMPVVDLSITEDPSLEVGSEFTVVVSLANNESDVVKAAEAILTYCDALEVVSTNSASAVASEEGTLFAKAAAIEGNNQIGFVAASCGGWTTLEGNSTLGTVTFRVKSEITGTCEIELTSVQLFDNTGEIIEIEGETIPLSGVSTLPTSYALYQNYPNPFNPTTNIQFDLKDAGHVKIMVFNTLGQVVATIADRELEAGRHTVSFDASNLASGLYLYSINVNGFSDLKKMVLIR